MRRDTVGSVPKKLPTHYPATTLAYFQSLGLDPANLVFSDYTSEGLYKEGAKRGAIDPCFPSKIGIPHVHNLLHHKHKPDKPLDVVFFPMIDSLPTFLEGVLDTRACPTVSATPEATKAAFIKESNLFKDHGLVYKNTFVKLNDPPNAAYEMFKDWADLLGTIHYEVVTSPRGRITRTYREAENR